MARTMAILLLLLLAAALIALLILSLSIIKEDGRRALWILVPSWILTLIVLLGAIFTYLPDLTRFAIGLF